MAQCNYLDTGALLCKLTHDDIYPFIAEMVFIGLSQFTLHILLITIGAHILWVGFFSIMPYTILSHLFNDFYILNWNDIIFQ